MKREYRVTCSEGEFTTMAVSEAQAINNVRWAHRLLYINKNEFKAVLA